MGLDMYLNVSRYVGGCESGKDAKFDRLCKLSGIVPCDDSPSLTVKGTVGYWRKANAIHRWFVENVQGGVDQCQESYVSREQLHELRAACRQVLDTVELVEGAVRNGTQYANGVETPITEHGHVVAQAGIAAKVLPTASGFFFGSTDYDQWYIQDLRDTVTIIDRVLSTYRDSHWSFSYRASW